MAFGLSRWQPRSTRPPLEPIPDSSLSHSQSWLEQRGVVLFEAAADMMGGFPGYADQGGELRGVVVRVTERFLLADEGKPHGFGVPVQWLDGTMLLPRADGDDPDLRVFYSDGALARLFTVRFRPNRLAVRGGKRAERAQDALGAAGLADSIALAPPESPDFALTWEETHEFDDESVIWSGHAAAPVRVGEELAPSEVWLSTNSLIWGSSDGDGLNRVPLRDVSDFNATRMKDRLGTPVVHLGVSGEQIGRHELSFVFNQHETPDLNFRDRGGLLVGLRSLMIPEGSPAPLWQPWRLDILPASRRGEAAVEAKPSLPSAEPELAAPETPGVRTRLESWLPKLQMIVNRGLALPSAADERATVIAFEPPADAKPLTPDTAPTEPIWFETFTGDAKPEPVGAMDIDLAPVVPVATSKVDQFENAALALVADAIRAIEVRLETGLLEPLAAWTPLTQERDAAFAELREAAARKSIKKREMRQTIARLTNIYDAGVRLRSLAELHDRGCLDNAQLDRLRSKLLERVELAPSVVPFAAPSETAATGEAFLGV
jgi:hypothetical protein